MTPIRPIPPAAEPFFDAIVASRADWREHELIVAGFLAVEHLRVRALDAEIAGADPRRLAILRKLHDQAIGRTIGWTRLLGLHAGARGELKLRLAARRAERQARATLAEINDDDFTLRD